MQIIRGPQHDAIKVVVYGPEGIGKSTFAAHFPAPVFIDTEGSTKWMDVDRTEPPTSWAMLKEQLDFIRRDPLFCNTIVLDTMDWAERMAISDLCAKYKINGLEDMGYGKAHVYLQEEVGRMLDILSDIAKNGVNVVITCHAKMRKFEQPDELGAYDRWELKLDKGVAPMVKEWADMVLFANYKTLVVNVDNQGAQKGKNKASGGKRVMYATHHPCWDAKNRFGLPDEMPFDFTQVASLFPENRGEIEEARGTETRIEFSTNKVAGIPVAPISSIPNKQTDAAETDTEKSSASTFTEVPSTEPPVGDNVWEDIPRKLADLMRQAAIEPYEVERAVVKKGYFPSDMHIAQYPGDFVDGVLVGAWPQIKAFIEADPDRSPFKN
jgi:hypothetical protein